MTRLPADYAAYMAGEDMPADPPSGVSLARDMAEFRANCARDEAAAWADYPAAIGRYQQAGERLDRLLEKREAPPCPAC